MAAPLLAISIGGAIAGNVTNVTADWIGQIVSKRKLDEAQTILNRHRILTEQIERKHSELTQIANTLSGLLNISTEQMMGFLMFGPSSPSLRIKCKIGMFTTGKLLLMVGNPEIVKVSKIAGKSAVTAVGKASSRAVARAFGVVLVGVCVIWDAVVLVTSAVEIAKGCTVEAARMLRRAARELVDSGNEIKENMQSIR